MTWVSRENQVRVSERWGDRKESVDIATIFLDIIWMALAIWDPGEELGQAADVVLVVDGRMHTHGDRGSSAVHFPDLAVAAFFSDAGFVPNLVDNI